MTPILKNIDHVHVYTKDRAAAKRWFADVLAMTRLEKFLPWAEGGGPLTLANPTDTIHIALFERESFEPTTSIAFGASGEQFLNWKSYFEAKGIATRIDDHDMAYSLYFHDLDKNMYEITTYDAEIVRDALN